MKTVLLLLVFIVCCAAQFSFTGKQQIVDAHNRLRSSIANGTYFVKGKNMPPGANILKMKWNSTIETSAQKFADTCLNGSYDNERYGENLYVDWGYEPIDVLDSYGVNATNFWEKELQVVNWFFNMFGRNEQKNAIQMVWAKTGSVGCGIKVCAVDPLMDNKNLITVVCRYDVRADVVNKPMYKEGETCSACPSPTECGKVSGLCV